jgi:hypothetical protein
MRKDTQTIGGKNGQRLRVGDKVESLIGERGEITEVGREHLHRGTRSWIKLDGERSMRSASRFEKVV